MFRLIGEALAPSADGEAFLAGFFLTESADPVGLLRRWSARRKIPPGIAVAYCTRPDDLATMLTDATVLVIENSVVGAAHLAQARSLKLIQLFGREAPGLDRGACARQNILVRPLDRYSNRLVAEHVIMLMLALTHGLDASRAALREPPTLLPGGWAYNWPACPAVGGLAGRVVGLVGSGRSGRWSRTICARSAPPFSMMRGAGAIRPWRSGSALPMRRSTCWWRVPTFCRCTFRAMPRRAT